MATKVTVVTNTASSNYTLTNGEKTTGEFTLSQGARGPAGPPGLSGASSWDDIEDKPAAITGTTASFTTALASKLDGIEAGATGDQDLSGLLTISTAASTYAPISTTVTLAGTQTITGIKTFSNLSSESPAFTGETTMNNMLVDVDASFGQFGTVAFNGTTYTYGTGSALAHRTALGLGALATVTPGTNVATALAINADATGGIFRQGQALSATTVTASANGAASTPSVRVSGVPFAGTGTTSFPLVYINDANATASTVLSTSGTYLGINGDGSQDLIHAMKDGATMFKVSSSGGLVAIGFLTLGSSNSRITVNSNGKFQVTNNAVSAGVTLDVTTNGVLNVRNKDDNAAGDITAGNLTASGTVTAAQYLYTTALFVTESTTARTLTSADHGKTIVCTNASAVAITLNTGLPTCFFVTIIQKGTGQVTVSGTATLEVFTGFAAKTAGQHAQMSVSNYGTSNVYHVAGQLGT